ncbi:MAG: RNA ligase (ATP) [Enterococcus sp.]|nr:RNA ligase (ATP) [Enterococcus sp.]
MSSFAVTLEKITVRQHPNADRLELARVGLFDAVVGKGQFKTGDVVLYIPEQAILPNSVIRELGLEGKLAGKELNRVKAVSLRGALSQGIVAPLSLINTFPEDNCYTDIIHALQTMESDTLSTYDFAPALGITKWEPEIPEYMKGSIAPATNILKWVDIENIKRFPDIFTHGEHVTVTEKVHGVCLMSTLTIDNGAVTDVVVASKGYGDKRLGFSQDKDNLYWRAVNSYNVRELATELARLYANVQSVGVYGEVYGLGIQDLNYGTPGKQGTPGFAVFDAYIKTTDGTGFWVPSPMLRGTATDIPKVPVLFEGGYDIDHIASIASGKEQISGTEANLREGVVIRSTEEKPWVDMFGNSHRKIAKFITAEYLTRSGGTEYQ